jgi:uncharacterized caspase-like protein
VADYPKIKNFMTQTASKAGLQLVAFFRKKSELNPALLQQALNQLDCSQEDVVWFYYIGHGYNDYETGSGQFSAFELTDATETMGVPLEWVHQQIQRKKPRLSLIFFDCCNYQDFQMKQKVRLSDSDIQGFTRLFGQAEGYIKASSNRAGHLAYSWGNPQTGGIFTNAFLRALYDVILGNPQQCSWQNVMSKTQTYTTQQAILAGLKQSPHFEINIRQF